MSSTRRDRRSTRNRRRAAARRSRRPVPDHECVFVPAEVVTSLRVLRGQQPIRTVVHHRDGGWTACCGTTADVELLQGMPLWWLRRREDVGHLVHEPAPGRGMWRDSEDDPWEEFEEALEE